MEWFSVILISSAFSSVPELDSRRRIPLASSWHNDSLTKVSRKRFQNHRKLIQTHPFKDDSSSKSVIFVHKISKLAILSRNFEYFPNWVEQLESYDGKSTGSDPGASYRKLKKQNFCWNHDYIEKKPLKPMLKKYQGRNRFVKLWCSNQNSKTWTFAIKKIHKLEFLERNSRKKRYFWAFLMNFSPTQSKISKKCAKYFKNNVFCGFGGSEY